MRKGTAGLVAIVVAVVLLLSSVFIVDERENGLILQFGRVVSVKTDPGLAFKIPLIQEVVRYDDRILSRDIDPLEVTPLDDRRLVVDAFARYRIADVERFRQAVGVGGISAAESRLDSILRSQTREILGSVSSNDILSADRAALMLRIRNGAIGEARNLGLEIIDVRLKRTDLPRENLDATFARMRAEREREAADEIARGNEAAQRIRAQADRTQVELVSDANREADIARGQADALRNAIYAKAYGADTEFFEFYRSLAAYERAIRGENSTLVMSPNGEFFNYLRSATPGAAEVPPTGAAPAAATGTESRDDAAVTQPASQSGPGAPGNGNPLASVAVTELLQQQGQAALDNDAMRGPAEGASAFLRSPDEIVGQLSDIDSETALNSLQAMGQAALDMDAARGGADGGAMPMRSMAEITEGFSALDADTAIARLLAQGQSAMETDMRLGNSGTAADALPQVAEPAN